MPDPYPLKTALFHVQPPISDRPGTTPPSLRLPSAAVLRAENTKGVGGGGGGGGGGSVSPEALVIENVQAVTGAPAFGHFERSMIFDHEAARNAARLGLLFFYCRGGGGAGRKLTLRQTGRVIETRGADNGERK